MNFKEIQAKSVLHYHDTKFASNYDLNIYRGCEHRCEYCFAQYSHKYLESDFFNDIYVKTNVAEILDNELTKNPERYEIYIIAESIPINEARALEAYCIRYFLSLGYKFSLKKQLHLEDGRIMNKRRELS